MRGKVIVQVMDWNLNLFIVRTISAAHGKTFFFATHLETIAYTLSLFSPLYQRFQTANHYTLLFTKKSNPLTPLPVPQYNTQE
jgi:hypothetical protein